MHGLRMTILTGATMLVAATGAGAQVRASASVPPGFMPPAGLCRVWYDGVAPGRQPAPTNCATARANLRPGTRLVVGSSLRTGANRDGTWNDGRRGNDERDGRWSDGRRGGDDRDGRWNQGSDKERKEWEKARRKQDHEREKSRRKAEKHHGRNHDGDDDEDEDDDDDHDDDRRGRDNRDVLGGRTGRNGGILGRVGIPSGQGGTQQQCVDVNRDGVCDNTQGIGRVRIP